MTAPARTMRDCPRYDRCSVPICPLDRDWHRRAVDQGEAVCAYLRETARPGARARFVGRYDEFALAAAFRLRDELAASPHPRYGYILKQIEATAGNPSMIERGGRLRGGRGKTGVSADVGRDSTEGMPPAEGDDTSPAEARREHFMKDRG